MSYFLKRAAGYHGTEGIEDPWQVHENVHEGENTRVANFNGPKDWIIKYPNDDPESQKIIGFRCLEDDIPRNSLTEKCEDTFRVSSKGADLGSRFQRGTVRIEQVLGQCNYIASLKGMDVSEIRQKLHEDEQEFLQQSRIKNADSGPIYYFVNPPTLKRNETKSVTNKKGYGSRDSPQPFVAGKEKVYDDSSISSEDEYSQEFVPKTPKCCDEEDPDIPEGLRSFTRGISSPTDYEEDDANISHFFNMVQRIQEKCDKVKEEDSRRSIF